MMNIVSKILLAVTALIVSAVSYANTGYYVQGDVLTSKMGVKDFSGTLKKNKVGTRIAVGKDNGNLRYQADYTYFGKVKDDTAITLSDGTVTVNVGRKDKFTAHSVGFSTIYDFDTKTALQPYVGLRLGVNLLDVDIVATATNVNTTYSATAVREERKTQVGIGALAGVQYNINSKFSVDAGVEYNYLGKAEKFKFNQYGASVGLRYNF